MAGELDHVQKSLRELRKSLKSLPANPAPEKVHKLRTAARKVQAAATILEHSSPKKSRRLAKAIEPVRKAAGHVRDMDVLTEHAGKLARKEASESLGILLAHLENARQENAAELARQLHHRRKSIRKALKEYSRSIAAQLERKPDSQHKASSRIQEKINSAAINTVRELANWPPLGKENLHEFRLQFKALRYTLQMDDEADADLLEALGDVQSRIGDWHDWQQFEKIARDILRLEQDQPLLDSIKQTAHRKLNRALAAASALRAKYFSRPIAVGV